MASRGSEVLNSVGGDSKIIGGGSKLLSWMSKGADGLKVGAKPGEALANAADGLKVGAKPGEALANAADGLQVGAKPGEALPNAADGLQVGAKPGEALANAADGLQVGAKPGETLANVAKFNRDVATKTGSLFVKAAIRVAPHAIGMIPNQILLSAGQVGSADLTIDYQLSHHEISVAQANAEKHSAIKSAIFNVVTSPIMGAAGSFVPEKVLPEFGMNLATNAALTEGNNIATGNKSANFANDALSILVNTAAGSFMHLAGSLGGGAGEEPRTNPVQRVVLHTEVFDSALHAAGHTGDLSHFTMLPAEIRGKPAFVIRENSEIHLNQAERLGAHLQDILPIDEQKKLVSNDLRLRRPAPGVVALSIELSSADLGPLVGEGMNKKVYEYGDNKVVAVEESAVPISRELQMLHQLKVLGVPTVDAVAATVDGKPAMVMDRYALGSQKIVSFMEIRGSSSLLNDRSVTDLEKIREVMIGKKIRIDNLQFLIGKNGEVVVADPIGVHVGRQFHPGGGPSKINLLYIDLLIQASKRNASGEPPPPGIEMQRGSNPLDPPGDHPYFDWRRGLPKPGESLAALVSELSNRPGMSFDDVHGEIVAGNNSQQFATSHDPQTGLEADPASVYINKIHELSKEWPSKLTIDGSKGGRAVSVFGRQLMRGPGFRLKKLDMSAAFASKSNSVFFFASKGDPKGEQGIHISADANHAPDLAAFLVRSVLKHPDQYPGVKAVVIAGPDAAIQRSDNVIVHIDKTKNVSRVLEAIFAYQQTNPDHFRPDILPMTEPAFRGVSTGAGPTDEMMHKAGIIAADHGLPGKDDYQHFDYLRAVAVYLAYKDAGLSSPQPPETQNSDLVTTFRSRLNERFSQLNINPDFPARNNAPRFEDLKPSIKRLGNDPHTRFPTVEEIAALKEIKCLKSYATAAEAGSAALSAIDDLSKKSGLEISGWITQDLPTDIPGKRYWFEGLTFGTQHEGTLTSRSLSFTDDNVRFYKAIFHSHADYAVRLPNDFIITTHDSKLDSFNSDDFSKTDKETAQRLANGEGDTFFSFLITPSGEKLYWQASPSTDNSGPPHVDGVNRVQKNPGPSENSNSTAQNTLDETGLVTAKRSQGGEIRQKIVLAPDVFEGALRAAGHTGDLSTMDLMLGEIGENAVVIIRENSPVHRDLTALPGDHVSDPLPIDAQKRLVSHDLSLRPASPGIVAHASSTPPLPLKSASGEAYPVWLWPNAIPSIFDGHFQRGGNVHFYAIHVDPATRAGEVAFSSSDIQAHGVATPDDWKVNWLTGHPATAQSYHTVNEQFGVPPAGKTWAIVASRSSPADVNAAGGLNNVPWVRDGADIPGPANGVAYGPPGTGFGANRWRDKDLGVRPLGAVNLGFKARAAAKAFLGLIFDPARGGWVWKDTAYPADARYLPDWGTALIGAKPRPPVDPASGLSLVDAHNHTNNFVDPIYIQLKASLDRIDQGITKGMAITAMPVPYLRQNGGRWGNYADMDVASLTVKYSHMNDWRLLAAHEMLPHGKHLIIPSITGAENYRVNIVDDYGSKLSTSDYLAMKAIYFHNTPMAAGEYTIIAKELVRNLTGRTGRQKTSKPPLSTDVGDEFGVDYNTLYDFLEAHRKRGLVVTLHTDESFAEFLPDGRPVARAGDSRYIYQQMKLLMELGPYDVSHLDFSNPDFTLSQSEIANIVANGPKKRPLNAIVAHWMVGNFTRPARHHIDLMNMVLNHPLLTHVNFDTSWLSQLDGTILNSSNYSWGPRLNGRPTYSGPYLDIAKTGRAFYGADNVNVQTREQLLAAWNATQPFAQALDHYDSAIFNRYAGNGYREAFEASELAQDWAKYQDHVAGRFDNWVSEWDDEARRASWRTWVQNYEAAHPEVRDPQKFQDYIARDQVPGQAAPSTMNYGPAPTRPSITLSDPNHLQEVSTKWGLVPTADPASMGPWSQRELEAWRGPNGESLSAAAIKAGTEAAHTGVNRYLQLATVGATQVVEEGQRKVNDGLAKRGIKSDSRIKKQFAAAFVGLTGLPATSPLWIHYIGRPERAVVPYLVAAALATRGGINVFSTLSQQLNRKLRELGDEQGAKSLDQMDFEGHRFLKYARHLSLDSSRLSGGEGSLETFNRDALALVAHMTDAKVDPGANETEAAAAQDWRHAVIQTVQSLHSAQTGRALGTDQGPLQPSYFRTRTGQAFAAIASLMYEAGLINAVHDAGLHPMHVFDYGIALGTWLYASHQALAAISGHHNAAWTELPLPRKVMGMGANAVSAAGLAAFGVSELLQGSEHAYVEAGFAGLGTYALTRLALMATRSELPKVNPQLKPHPSDSLGPVRAVWDPIFFKGLPGGPGVEQPRKFPQLTALAGVALIGIAAAVFEGLLNQPQSLSALNPTPPHHGHGYEPQPGTSHQRPQPGNGHHGHTHAAPKARKPEVYTAQPGDELISIARKHQNTLLTAQELANKNLGENERARLAYEHLLQLNGRFAGDPNLVPEGQTVKVGYVNASGRPLPWQAPGTP